METIKKSNIINFFEFLLIRLSIISSILLLYSISYEDDMRNVTFSFVANNTFLGILGMLKLFIFAPLGYIPASIPLIVSYFIVLVLLTGVYCILYKFKFNKTEKVFTVLYIILSIMIGGFMSGITA